MGLTYVDAELANPAGPGRRERVRFLVDSGAIYSLAPSAVLRRLGIRALRREEFELADGSTMRRQVGLVLFRVGNTLGGSEVIFGGSRDEPLLGAVTLEALGFELDPVRRRLRRTRLLMAGFRRPSRRVAHSRRTHARRS
jgi:predicted aspartyl protease